MTRGDSGEVPGSTPTKVDVPDAVGLAVSP